MTVLDIPVIFSDRKSVCVEIRRDGTPVIRAPKRMPTRQIEDFIRAHRSWIDTHISSVLEKKSKTDLIPALSEAEKASLSVSAERVIPDRFTFFAERVGVTYGKLTLRFMKSKWGSCSANGDIRINTLLMLAPPFVLDAIVIHELCHRKQMNHSAAFYREVYRVCPDYDKAKAWLKENGAAILARLS